MKYRAVTNGNIVELSPEAAALLVPGIYEEVKEEPPQRQPPEGKRKK